MSSAVVGRTRFRGANVTMGAAADKRPYMVHPGWETICGRGRHRRLAVVSGAAETAAEEEEVDDDEDEEEGLEDWGQPQALIKNGKKTSNYV